MWALGGALVIYSLILFLRNYRCMAYYYRYLQMF